MKYNRYSRRCYRARDGIFLGVCKGVADYFDFRVFWVRAIFIFLMLVSKVWPLAGLYFLAAMLMKPRPTAYH